ncbi:MAG: hypothetical protein HDT11_04340 [Helicobacter sp.]|nr:hypothetical protein [Helicobacter sp.]
MSNSTWENRNNQSGAVLWLRHSFARAFFSDSEGRLRRTHCVIASIRKNVWQATVLGFFAC